MTDAARHLIDSFEALPAEAQHEVLAQLLRRSTIVEYTALPEVSLLHAADVIFQGYDRRESGV